MFLAPDPVAERCITRNRCHRTLRLHDTGDVYERHSITKKRHRLIASVDGGSAGSKYSEADLPHTYRRIGAGPASVPGRSCSCSCNIHEADQSGPVTRGPPIHTGQVCILVGVDTPGRKPHSCQPTCPDCRAAHARTH
jgi:hypothetical protein